MYSLNNQFAKFVFLLIFALFSIECAAPKTSQPAASLPTDILGLRVGEAKNDAENRLKEIGKLIRIEEKKQEVWVLKDDPHFSHLAVGYDGEDRLRYVTAYTKPTGGTPIKADAIGDLSKAKSETVGPNYTYVWQVPDTPAADDPKAYKVTVRGNQPETFSFYTLSAAFDRESEEEEEREREEKERGGESIENKGGESREEREREEREEREEKERDGREKKERENKVRDADQKDAKDSGE